MVIPKSFDGGDKQRNTPPRLDRPDAGTAHSLAGLGVQIIMPRTKPSGQYYCLTY